MQMYAGLFCALAGVLCVTASSAEETSPTLPLRIPEAPFLIKAPAVMQTFTPVLEGNVIVCGNKRLEVERNGALRLLADGQVVLDHVASLLATVDKKTGAKNWLSTADNQRCKADLCSFVTSGNTITCRRVLPLSDKLAEYTQTLTLQEDGLIRLETAWVLPTDAQFTALPSSLVASVPQARAQNQRLLVNQKSYTIPLQPEYTFLPSDAKTVYERIEFLPDTTAGFVILPQTIGGLRFYLEKAGATSYSFRFYEDSRTKRLSLLFDLRRGTAAAPAGQTCAGINFRAVENLTLPDRQRNLIVNPSFEQGREGYWRDWGMLKYTSPEIWGLDAYALDAQAPHSGRRSLRLLAPASKPAEDYRAIGYALRSFSVPLAAGDYTFSLYAKGGEEGQRLSVWFPNASWVGYGNKHLPIGFTADGKGKMAQRVFPLTGQWQRYSLTFQVPQSMPVFASIGVDTPGKSGFAWIDDLQLESGSAASAYSSAPVMGQLQTSSPDNFLRPADKINARLTLTSRPSSTGRVALSVRNFFGEEIHKFEADFTCDSAGCAEVPLPLEQKLGRGIFLLRADYTLAGGQQCYEIHRLAIMDFLGNDFRLKNLFSDDYGDAMLGRFDVRQLLERYRKVGIGATCHNYVWDKPAWDLLREYRVEPFDAPMGSITRSFVGGDYFTGQKVLKLEIIDYSTRTHLTMETPAEHLNDNAAQSEAYLEQIRVAAARVAGGHPWIKIWTLSGEIFHHWPYSWWAREGTQEKATANCAKMLAAFAEGVKRGNPQALVYQGTPTNLGVDAGIKEIDQTLQAVASVSKTKFDLVGCHTYRLRPESPDLDADTQTLLDVMAKDGYDKTPIFFGEGMHFGPYSIPQWGIESASWLPPSCWYYGPLSYDMGWNEKISAAWRARCWLIALKHQNRLLTSMSGAFINNFDMDLDLTPYATQKISNTLGRLLGDAEFRRDIRFAPYTRCYVFEDAQKRPVAAIWGFHPKLDSGSMEAPLAKTNFNGTLAAIFDLMEQERAVGPDAEVTFPVSSFPLFLRGKPGTIAAFSKALEDCALVGGSDITPLMVSGKPASPAQQSVVCRNFLSKPFAGSLQCAGQTRALTIPAAGTQTLALPLPNPLTPAAITANSLPCVIHNGANTFNADLGFRGLIAQKARHEIKIDGDLTDWQDVPEVAFTETCIYDKTPSDAKNHSGWFKVAWTEKGIYLAARIRDNTLIAEQQSDPEQRWNNDSFQVYFDSFCDAATRQQTGYDENDYDYTIYPKSSLNAAEVFRRRTPDPQLGLAVEAPRDRTIAADIPAGFQKWEDGYSYEIFFPAKYLLPIRLEKGSALGFGLTSNDRDGKNVRAALSLTPAGSQTTCFNQPHLWPALLLWEDTKE